MRVSLEQDSLDEGANSTGDPSQPHAETHPRSSHRLRDGPGRIAVAHRAHHVALSGVFREAEEPQAEEDDMNLHGVSWRRLKGLNLYEPTTEL